MTKKIQMLSIFLALQIGLIAFFATKKSPTAVFQSNENVLALKKDDINSILIEDKDKEKILLTKESGKWTLSNEFKFPVSEKKLTEFLDTLTSVKKTWPVGNTTSAADQLSVTDDTFEKRVTLTLPEDKKLVVYIGTSPSFKKVHFKVQDDSTTYTANFNASDASTKTNYWMDKTFASVEPESIQSASIKDLTITKTESGFTLGALPEGKLVDEAKVKTVLTTMLKPDLEDVLSDDVKKMDSLAEALRYSVVMTGGDKSEYALFTYKAKSEKGELEEAKDFYALNISKYPYYLKVRRSRVAELFELKKELLLKDEASKEAPVDSLDQDKIAKKAEVKTN